MYINNENWLKILLERDRLNRPPDSNVRATGIGIARFVVSCESNAINVLNLAKETLEIVTSYYEVDWPSIDKWKSILPKKFVNHCASELTNEEELMYVEMWPNLSEEEKQRKGNSAWTLSAWLYWLEPENREWFWWKAYEFDDEEIKNTHFLIEVTVYNQPFLWGSLKWLFKACGAIDVVSTDDL